MEETLFSHKKLIKTFCYIYNIINYDVKSRKKYDFSSAIFFCVTKTRDFAGTGTIQFSMNFPDFCFKEQKSPKLDASDLGIF